MYIEFDVIIKVLVCCSLDHMIFVIVYKTFSSFTFSSGDVDEFSFVLFLSLHILVVYKVLDSFLYDGGLCLEVLNGSHHFRDQIVKHHGLICLHLLDQVSLNNLVSFSLDAQLDL